MSISLDKPGDGPSDTGGVGGERDPSFHPRARASECRTLPMFGRARASQEAQRGLERLHGRKTAPRRLSNAK